MTIHNKKGASSNFFICRVIGNYRQATAAKEARPLLFRRQRGLDGAKLHRGNNDLSD
jgi:hypothetical protein